MSPQRLQQLLLTVMLTVGPACGIAHAADNFVGTIPEPATLALLGAGVVGMIVAGRNRNKRK